MAIGGVVTAAAQTHVQLLAGRALVGIGMAPAECLAGVLVADLFYLVS
jgi:MFS family permease